MFEEEEYIIPELRGYSYRFPDPRSASDEGLLAYGGDLSVPRLLSAYRNGIFPWYNEGDPILWWSPNPRLLLFPNKFKVRKSFRRVLRSGKFSVTFDHSFTPKMTFSLMLGASFKCSATRGLMRCKSVRRLKRHLNWLMRSMPVLGSISKAGVVCSQQVMRSP